MYRRAVPSSEPAVSDTGYILSLADKFAVPHFGRQIQIKNLDARKSNICAGRDAWNYSKVRELMAVDGAGVTNHHRACGIDDPHL